MSFRQLWHIRIIVCSIPYEYERNFLMIRESRSGLLMLYTVSRLYPSICNLLGDELVIFGQL